MSADDHGSASTYSNHGCRCDLCKRAWADLVQRLRSNREALAPETRTDIMHGRAATYTNHRCRCDACRIAWATYYRELYRARREAAS